MEPNKIITLEKVSFQYRESSKKNLLNLDFSIDQGQFILICGATGSGKTSFIRTLNGLIPHFYHGTFYGYIRVKGQDTVDTPTDILAKSVGMVFQIPENQLFAMTVERELVFGLENLNTPREIIKRNVDNAVKLTGIQNLLTRAPYELSGGEQQKVAITALLAMEPEIIALDEPLSNLDPQSAIGLMELLKSIHQKKGTTIILVEHRIEYALRYVDELLVIDQGQLIHRGSPLDLLNNASLKEKGIDIPSIFLWMERNNFLKPPFSPSVFNYAELGTMILNGLKLQNLPQKVQGSNKPEFIQSEKQDLQPKYVLQNVGYSYISKYSTNIALKSISTTFYQKEIIGIMGPNGAGKSTLIKCLAGLYRPQTGQIWFEKHDILQEKSFNILSRIGIVLQNPDHQLFSSSVLEEIRFSLKSLHLTPEVEKERIQEIFNRLELNELKDSAPFMLSGGQKKKVALASILCRDPEVIIFDEPTTGQDAIQKERIKAIILEEQRKGKLILIISHDLEFLGDITTRILVLYQGDLMADGPTHEVLTNDIILQKAALVISPITSIARQIHANYPTFSDQLLTLKDLEKEIRATKWH